MNSDIEQIESMLDTGIFESEKMNTILSHYQDHPAIIACGIKAGAKIIRSSLNDDNKFHYSINRLNYPPVEYARTDRASLKGKPMFYASIFTTAAEKDNAYPRIISALETTDILRDFNKKGRTFTTQSLWLPDTDLKLFAFPFSKNYKRSCEEIKFQRKYWDENLIQHWSKEYIEFSEYIGDLIAEQQHSCLYDITANAIQYILYKSSDASRLDGIMYPSAWGEGQGMNICLKPEVVDKHVHFQGASVQMIDKQIGDSTILKIADSYLTSDGTLKWIPTDFAFDKLVQAYGLQKLLETGTLYFGLK